MKAHEWVKTEVGQRWYKRAGAEWLASPAGRYYLGDHVDEFLKTEAGRHWFAAEGAEWLDRVDEETDS